MTVDGRIQNVRLSKVGMEKEEERMMTDFHKRMLHVWRGRMLKLRSILHVTQV